MRPTSASLDAARDAFDQRSWKAVHSILTEVRESLDAADLWRLAMASYLLGREQDFLHAGQDAHQAYCGAGEVRAAARVAFWIAFHLLNRGELAQATGWLGRAARLLHHEEEDCAEQGYLLLPAAQQHVFSGDLNGAARMATRAVAIGQASGDRDLVALALHVQGRVLLRQDRVEAGLALLHEAMVGVATGELSPQVTGLIYCSVIGACREVGALRQVREWTAALAEWCEQQPEMVAYAGECRVYRAEILQVGGEWQKAMEEARHASEQLAAGWQRGAAGLAKYAEAEVHRLRGDLAAAEEAYRTASRHGRGPQPGLALLRAAQGDRAAAAASLRRALAETGDRTQRAKLLPAFVEIMLECGEGAEAKAACDELEQLAASYPGGVLATFLARARGAIALHDGSPMSALPLLRHAWYDWQALDAPYEAARTRVLIAIACAELGDRDGATLEFDLARAEFERLGARLDVARVDALTRRGSRTDHGLTRRESEVLALVATGRTNRAIASELSISERTVARHVANIFAKLAVSSRAAATAYAFKHNIVGRTA